MLYGHKLWFTGRVGTCLCLHGQAKLILAYIEPEGKSWPLLE